MKFLKLIATLLVVLGGLHLGLLGALHINLINMIFGGFSGLTTIIYSLVGLSTVYYIVDDKPFDGVIG